MRQNRAPKWSAEKRAAFKLSSTGLPDTDVAAQIGVHRHTIRRWRSTPEWSERLRTTLEERGFSRSLRLRHTTNKMVEALWREAELLIKNDFQGERGRTALILTEVRSWMRLQALVLGNGDGVFAEPEKPKSGEPNKALTEFLRGYEPTFRQESERAVAHDKAGPTP